MDILRISKTKAYEFIKSNPPFPVISIGRTKRIPKVTFYKWLSELETDNIIEIT
jgi:hypothetical protein